MYSLRWFVRERHYSTWDSRWDEEVKHQTQDKPVLQYMTPNGVWHDVPTVKEIHES